MRRLLALAALTALAGGALPALAVSDVPACEVPGGARVVALGSSASPFETPQIPLLDTTTQELVVVLPTDEGAPTAVDLNITLSWPTPVSDFDLTVTGPDGTPVDSLNTNALDGTTESVSLSGVGQCSSVMVEVWNFAGNPLEELTLAVVATA